MRGEGRRALLLRMDTKERLTMASEVPKPLMIGNFKKPKRERGHENSDWRERRPGMDAKHLANIRRLPCCIPGCKKDPGGQAHHLKDTGAKERGMGVKSTDKHCVPLCEDHHLHGVERVGAKKELEWFAKFGIEALDLAAALWGARGDLETMRRIVLSNKE